MRMKKTVARLFWLRKRSREEGGNRKLTPLNSWLKYFSVPPTAPTSYPPPENCLDQSEKKELRERE